MNASPWQRLTLIGDAQGANFSWKNLNGVECQKSGAGFILWNTVDQVTNTEKFEAYFNSNIATLQTSKTNTGVLRDIRIQQGSGTYIQVGAGGVGINDTVPTHALTFAQGSSGIAFYNTADQVTNWERGLIQWNGNAFTISTDKGAAGTYRNIFLKREGLNANTYLEIVEPGFFLGYGNPSTVMPATSTSLVVQGRFTGLGDMPPKVQLHTWDSTNILALDYFTIEPNTALGIGGWKIGSVFSPGPGSRGLHLFANTSFGSDCSITMSDTGIEMAGPVTVTVPAVAWALTTAFQFPSSTASRSSLRIQPGAPPTAPSDGDMWYDLSERTLDFFASGIERHIGGSIFNQTADKVVANTAVETSMFGVGSGTRVLPAAFWASGTTLFCELRSKIAKTGSPTVQVRAYLGTTLLLDTGAQSPGAFSGDEYMRVSLKLTCRTPGNPGQIGCAMTVEYHRGAGVGTYECLETIPASVAVDTTTPKTLDITFQWGTANALNTITTVIGSVGLQQ